MPKSMSNISVTFPSMSLSWAEKNLAYQILSFPTLVQGSRFFVLNYTMTCKWLNPSELQQINHTICKQRLAPSESNDEINHWSNSALAWIEWTSLGAIKWK